MLQVDVQTIEMELKSMSRRGLLIMMSERRPILWWKVRETRTIGLFFRHIAGLGYSPESVARQIGGLRPDVIAYD